MFSVLIHSMDIIILCYTCVWYKIRYTIIYMIHIVHWFEICDLDYPKFTCLFPITRTHHDLYRHSLSPRSHPSYNRARYSRAVTVRILLLMQKNAGWSLTVGGFSRYPWNYFHLNFHLSFMELVNHCKKLCLVKKDIWIFIAWIIGLNCLQYP